MKFACLIEPPFNFRRPDGNVDGCDVALARMLSEELGAGPFEPIETEFAELLPGVAEGLWRMTTGLFATEERRKTAAFSRPVWALPDGLLVQRGNPLGLTGYRSAMDTTDCRLAVIRDQFQHRTAAAFGMPEERFAIFETYRQAAEAVRDGRADTYASVGKAHDGFLARHPDWELETVTVPREEKVPAFGCLAFAHADTDFRQEVDTVLERYIGSPAHRTMMAKYGFSDAEIDLLIA